MELLYNQTREMIHYIEEMISFFRIQNYNYAYQSADKVVALLEEYMLKLPKNRVKELMSILELSLETMERQDGTELADIYETRILPILYEILQEVFVDFDIGLEDCWGKNRKILKKRFPEIYRMIIKVRENISDNYQITWAKTGDLVLGIATENYGLVRLNSICNPWREAMEYAKNIKNSSRLWVLGFGMGYHIEFLLKEKKCRKCIVLENDIVALAIALSYRDLTHLLMDDRLELLYVETKEDYFKHLSLMKTSENLCIWYPSVRTIHNNSLREMLENYKIELESAENLGDVLENNFKSNTEKADLEVSCLKKRFQNKKIILAGGGPSLDEAIDIIKEKERDEFILVCVGKVARKLIFAEVYPDFIIMTDGLERTQWQINGIEECGVPLIYLSTVAATVVENYRSERYIAFQEGVPLAEEFAGENGYPLYKSGGSVATFALDLLIRFECKSIICIGLDMGYLGERTHASGIGRKIVNKEKMRKVEGIISEYIYTSKTLDMYRIWIENRIKDVKNVELINASKGARIHGMKEVDLKDIL